MSPRSRRSLAVLAVIVAIGVALAWWQRFVVDDAFIAFRYARHAARGLGFVWNPGEEPLEGFTSFAWTALLTLACKLGLDPEPTSLAVGLGCFAGTLVATYFLALGVTRRRVVALVTAALVAMSPTMSAFATSGLETSAQVFLATATLAVLAGGSGGIRITSPRRAAAATALAALAVTVRMDAAPLLLLTIVVVARSGHRRPLAAPALVLAPWLAYRLATFHSLFPNTYAAKVAGDSGAWSRGLLYVATFGVLSMALPMIAFAVGSCVRAKARARVVAPSLAFVGLWCAYVTWVGADFMEFRFMAPLVPPAIVLFAWGACREIRARAPRIALAVSVAVVFLVDWRLTRGDDYFMPSLHVETVRALGNHIDHPNEDWRGIGRALHQTFAADSGVVLAVRPAGVIPYESDLPSVDVFGLNDRWVAANGEIDPDAASGHRRIAPVSYLVERRVSLVIGTSLIWMRNEPRKTYSVAEAKRQFLSRHDVVPPDARVVEIALDERRAFRALYLTPHPAVEAHLADPTWRVFPITR